MRPDSGVRPDAADDQSHLKVLHESGLLDREKRGVRVYYQARPEAMAALVTLIAGVGIPAGAAQ